MRFLIVTGMSGAGKSHALRFLEDIGFFCADNIPPVLILKFAELFFDKFSQSEQMDIALGVDIRGGKLFEDMSNVLSDLKTNGYDYEVLFLDASDDVLINRFKETRRYHPLSKTDPMLESIARERDVLSEIRAKSDYIVDTSDMLTRQLKERINEIFLLNREYDNLSITVVSFGYKYGLPSECDLILDVRFIPNPYYIPEMRELTGNDRLVFDYVTHQQETREFLEKMMTLLSFLIPNYIKEGKNNLVIGIGCTGGRHRSVSIAGVINEELKQLGYFSFVTHRDIYKPGK